jgi:hypothetical protein
MGARAFAHVRWRRSYRIGELAEEVTPQPGKRTDLQPNGGAPSRLEVARKAGLSADQLATALQVHHVPRVPSGSRRGPLIALASWRKKYPRRRINTMLRSVQGETRPLVEFKPHVTRAFRPIN